jgi:hypothetical protein
MLVQYVFEKSFNQDTLQCTPNAMNTGDLWELGVATSEYSHGHANMGRDSFQALQEA